MRPLWIALILVPAVVGSETITLKLGATAKVVVDVVSTPTEKLSQAEPLPGPTIKLDASGDQWIRVFDPATGNLAARKASDLNGKSRSADFKNEWTVFKTDYNRIGELRVRADQGGKPLALGSISIGDQTQLLTEESQGNAAFYGVPVGKVRISVSYRDVGETKSIAQGFDLPAVRDLPRPELVVVVPATAATPAAGPAKQDDGKLPPPKAAPAPTGVLGNLVAILFTAGGALALLYFGLRWIYGNQDKAKDTLTKLGVQIPDPVADPTPDPAPANPIAQPAPITPILLDPVPAAVAAPISQVPALVGPAGRFELTEGIHLIGREAGLTIALVGESTVSRRHAEIVRTGDTLLVRDLGSTNGTFVNGVRLTDDQSLRPGDRVQFGSVGFEIQS